MQQHAAVWDIYEIGGPAGFYIGLAKRLLTGGWERRIALHVKGQGNKGARRLLRNGAPTRCIGTVRSTRWYAEELERSHA